MSMKRQSRPNGAWETSRTNGLYRRLTLRRADGRVYLDRWGLGHPRVGSIMLHRMDAPDPGVDLHDHPWTFWSLILSGGYSEVRCSIRSASQVARNIEAQGLSVLWRGAEVVRRPGSIRRMRLDECHTIIELLNQTRSWSLIVTGPVRRKWGFYPPSGYMPEAEYDATIRAGRRDLWSDQASGRRPW